MPYLFTAGTRGSLFILGLLFEYFLDFCDQLGRTVNELGELLDGIGNGLHTNVQKIDVAVLVYDEEADRNDVETGSTASAEVLLQGSVGLAVEIKATRGKSDGDLGDRDDGRTARGIDRVADDRVCIDHIPYVFERGTDDFFEFVFACHSVTSFR